MSANNPGVIYDATNSWNGYNHQGKISLWYAISEIIKLYDPTISMDENKSVLSNYFLEIEYMEDFSIGKIENGETSYISVHQVKNRANKSIGAYEDAILGLLSHLSEHPNIGAIVLHTTESINLSGLSLLDNIKKFVKNPEYLIKDEKEIEEKRGDINFRENLTRAKPGQPSRLKKKLIASLENIYLCPQKLNDGNLDEAFNLYLDNIKSEKEKISLTPEAQYSKVSICTYTIDGNLQDYCPVDSAIDLLKSEIKEFYQKISPGHYKTGDDFVQKCTLWMLGKLDEHIIERNLNYSLYKKEILDKRILLSQIFEWLMSSSIDNHESWYYLYHIKEGLFTRLEKYCKVCTKHGVNCCFCNVTECKNKIGKLDFDAFKQFVHMTNPTVGGPLDIRTFADYLSPGISNPFAKGLRDIPRAFDSKRNAISYKDSDNYQCALTAILGEGSDGDVGLVSSNILMNSNIYDLLMDYDCLISKDINIPSIMDEEILQTPCFDSRKADHILHCKDVKIVSLNEFINSLNALKGAMK